MQHFNPAVHLLDPSIYTHGPYKARTTSSLLTIQSIPRLITPSCTPRYVSVISVQTQISSTLIIAVCVTSRYLNTSAIRLHGSPDPTGPDSYESRHQQILLLANDHLVWAFAEAKRELEVVQAMLTLAIWKEPHEERAPFFFNRVCGGLCLHNLSLLFRQCYWARSCD